MIPLDAEVPEECRRWDARYAEEACFFGERPSPLLVRFLESERPPPRRALCLGEGEGRDAAHLARRGWSVVAVDGAANGLAKLEARAREEGLTISAVRADLASYVPSPRAFHLVTSFYCHLAKEVRRAALARAAAALAPGGALVMAGFSEAQRRLGRTSGGPRDPEVLYDAGALREELSALFDEVTVEARVVELDLGRHRGAAEVVEAVARRRS